MPEQRKQSWIESANDPAHGNPLTHLPFSAFLTQQGEQRLCVAIGDRLLDLSQLHGVRPPLADALQAPLLNPLLSLGQNAWQELRAHLQKLLAQDAPASVREQLAPALHPLAGATLVKPLAIPNYTDFYASIHHATRVGQLFRPDQPLLPNYKHIPIGYHGRASSIVVSGSTVRRPRGQSRPSSGEAQPSFAPCAALDYELELGFIVGPPNDLGSPIVIDHAESHIFGVALLNDWSARDIQSWEYQPLGPFLAKSFATTLSPWITPLAALEPFRTPQPRRPPEDPHPLPYLTEQSPRAIQACLEVLLLTAAMREKGLPPQRLSSSSSGDLYWTAAQFVAHHTSNGCNLQTGDILATGTISGAAEDSAGCLLELTRNGTRALTLPNGETRIWLQDRDEIILRAACEAPGHPPLRLGECRATVLPALP